MDRLGAALLLMVAPERRAWQGRMPLATVFWGYGVVVSLALALLYATALDLGQVALQQGLILVCAAYTVWIVVAIWRSADNAGPFWSNLARLLTIAWALNSAFVLFFLQIELVLILSWG